MTSTVMRYIRASLFVVLGVALAVMGVSVANADDAPGSAALGFLLMFAGLVLAVRTLQNRLPRWATRTALSAGAVVAIVAGFVTHDVTARAALFSKPQDVPSVAAPAASPQWAAAIERARSVVRETITGQNLPGLSIAVSSSGTVVWAEGFGWRDVATKTPVTPETRFNIGTAAVAVAAPSAASLGLTSTGTEAVADWSPEHVGEPEEDFPPFTLVRHNILQPLGLAPLEYPLPGNRATFYVPRTEHNDPRRGRRLMYMRDLACCPNGTASFSTPSDLVRLAMATGASSVDGALAGGNVMSLVVSRDQDLAVAVASNIAHAGTAALAQRVADAFARQD